LDSFCLPGGGEGRRSVHGQDVKLHDDVLRLRSNASHGPVTHDPAVVSKQIRIGPTAFVPGVEANLAVHLLPMEIAESANLLQPSWAFSSARRALEWTMS